MFRPSRRRSGEEDSFLVWKVRLFALGAAVALAGIAFSNSWVVWAGIAVLGAAVILRLVIPRD